MASLWAGNIVTDLASLPSNSETITGRGVIPAGWKVFNLDQLNFPLLPLLKKVYIIYATLKTQLYPIEIQPLENALRNPKHGSWASETCHLSDKPHWIAELSGKELHFQHKSYEFIFLGVFRIFYIAVAFMILIQSVVTNPNGTGRFLKSYWDINIFGSTIFPKERFGRIRYWKCELNVLNFRTMASFKKRSLEECKGKVPSTESQHNSNHTNKDFYNHTCNLSRSLSIIIYTIYHHHDSLYLSTCA